MSKNDSKEKYIIMYIMLLIEKKRKKSGVTNVKDHAYCWLELSILSLWEARSRAADLYHC